MIKSKNYAWKVVGMVNKKMVSSSHDLLRPDEVVEYKFGEWAVPPTTLNPFLFVFDTRKNARIFRKCYGGKVIKVLVKNLTSERVGVGRCFRNYECFFSAYEFGLEGTMFADSVMPIKS